MLTQYDTENELDPNEIEQLFEDTAWKPEVAPEYHDTRYGGGIVNLKRPIMEEWIGVNLRGVGFGSEAYEHGETVSSHVPGNVTDTLSVAVPIEPGDGPAINLTVRVRNDTVTEMVAVEIATPTAGPSTATPTIGSRNETRSADRRTQNETGTSAPPLSGFGSLVTAIAVLLALMLVRYRR